MNEKKTKNAQPDLSNLSYRRREEVLKQQEQKKKTRIYLIVALVTVVLVAALLIWDSGVIQRSAAAYEVNGQSYSATDVSYYYFNEYSSFAPYASYYGLDTSLPLDEQEYSEGVTWYDYFLKNALSTIDEVAALTKEAKANGYTMSDEAQANVDAAIESIESAAVSYGVDTATYLTYCYGRYMTPSAYKNAVTEQYYAQDYASYKVENFEITEEDLADYYAENAATFDNFDFEAYLISVSLVAQYDDEGNLLDFDPDELAAEQDAMAEAAAMLEEAMIAGDDESVSTLVTALGASDMSSVSSAYLSYYEFGDWLTSDERVAGDVSTIEMYDTNSAGEEYLCGYYVVKFNGRSLDEYKGIDFYNMLIQAESVTAEDGTATYDWDAAKAEVEALEAQWLEGGGDAESFLTMAEENTDGSTVNYTNTSKDTQNEEVNEWLFGSEHEVGDYAIIEDSTLHGYRMVYFNGYNDLYYWQTIAKSNIENDRYSQWLADAQDGQTGTTTSFIAYINQ